jgi:hypothetical protein
MNRSKSILRSVIFRLLILYPFSLLVSSYLPMHKQKQNTHTHTHTHTQLDPMESDVRMRHEAIRLESGTKYAANIWYHMHDYDLAVGANGYN